MFNYLVVVVALYLCAACSQLQTSETAPTIDDSAYEYTRVQATPTIHKPYTPKPEGSVVAISGDNMWYWN